MDGSTLELTLFRLATFAGALVAGLTGFAFGLVVSAIWLYILTPLQTATLIIAFGLFVQGYSVWKLRGALDWRRLWPFMAGAALGVPRRRRHPDLGEPRPCPHGRRRLPGALQPLRAAPAGHPRGESGRRCGRRGCRLSQRRARRHHRACRNSRDIWCGLRGWSKDVQRAVFQPVAVAIFVMSAFVDRRQGRDHA